MTSTEVKLGRVEKRLRKVVKQRDYYKKQLEHYQSVIALQPYMLMQYNSYEKRRQEYEELKMLRKRVQEQSALISLMDLIKNTS